MYLATELQKPYLYVGVPFLQTGLPALDSFRIRNVERVQGVH